MCPDKPSVAFAGCVVQQGSPYLQHRVATLLSQHGRRHQNHPTRNPFWKSTLVGVFRFGPSWLLVVSCSEYLYVHESLKSPGVHAHTNIMHTNLNVEICRYFQHAHFIPIVGVGKRGAYLTVHGDLLRQHSFGTTLRCTGPVPADSWQ